MHTSLKSFPENERTSSDNSSLDHIIECIFNLSYKLFITPYTVHYDAKEGTKGVAGSQWKKVTSFILTLITATMACIATNSSFSRASIRSPAIIFKIAPDIGDTFVCFMFWYVIWSRKNEISHFFSLMSLQTFEMWRPGQFNIFIQKGKFLMSDRGNRDTQKSSQMTPGITIFCTVVIFLIVILDMLKLFARYIGPGPDGINQNSSVLGVAYQDIREGLLLDSQPAKSLAEMNSFEIGTSIIFFTFETYFMFFKAFAILLCLAGVAVVFKNANDFNEYLTIERDQLNIIQAFEAFREFVESINQITGPIMFGIAIVCAPTFYVANLSTILIVWNAESPITWLTVLLYGLILVWSAEVTNKTDEFREWILECGEGEYEEQLFANFVDLTQNPLGLRGMECFTVTYGFLAQMLSAVVTFTIILLQFQSS